MDYGEKFLFREKKPFLLPEIIYFNIKKSKERERQDNL